MVLGKNILSYVLFYIICRKEFHFSRDLKKIQKCNYISAFRWTNYNICKSLYYMTVNLYIYIYIYIYI